MATVRQPYDDKKILAGLAEHLSLDLGEGVRPGDVTVSFHPGAENAIPTAIFSVTLLWSVPTEDARKILRAAEL